jgi:phage-related minor tail protein
MANKIQIELVVDDKGSVQVKKFGDNVEQEARRSKSRIEELGGAFRKLAATLGAGISVQQVIKSMEIAVAAEQSERSFRMVARAAGESADSIIDAMKRATAETIDDSDLMQKAVKGLAMDLTGEQLIKLAETARTSARIIGKGVGETFDQIVDAVSTNMPRALKQMGLITTEQMKLFSEAVAKGAKDVELIDIVLANAGKQAEKFGKITDDNAERVQRLKAFWGEKVEIFGGAWVYGLTRWGEILEGLYGKAKQLRNLVLGEPLNELGRPEVRMSMPPKPEWMKTGEPAKEGSTPEQVMDRWKRSIADAGNNSQQAQDKWLNEYLRSVDARWDAEVKHSEQMGQLYMVEQKFRDDAIKKQADQEAEYFKTLEDIKLAQVEGEIEAREAAAKDIAKSAEAMKTAVTGWASEFSGTLNDALWEADFSFGNIAKSFAKMITQMVIQTQIIQPLLKSVFGGSGGGGMDWGSLISKGVGAIGSVFGGGAGASFEVPANNFDLMAQGGVFSGGRLTAFAGGGVVRRPTVFPFANGIGLMGERGSEAILPLARTSSGDLGVKSGGMKVEVHNYSGAQVRTEAAPDGATLRIIVEKIALDAMRNNPGTVADAWASEAASGNRRVLGVMRRLS